MTTMSEPSVPLWDALGRPPLDRVVPAVRSKQWTAARGFLGRLLAEAGSPRARFTPGKLWLLAKGTPPPRVFTWGQLCSGVAVGDVVSALTSGALPGALKFWSWNLRWLTSPTSTNSAVKRHRVLDACLRGHVVVLQETHWNAVDAQMWEKSFAGCTLVALPARLGPGGGQQGGVAVLLPPGYVYKGRSVVVPGCVMDVFFDLPPAMVQALGDSHPGASSPDTVGWAPFAVRAVYIPPDDRTATVLAMRDQPMGPCGNRYLFGDLNFDYASPRDAQEERLTAALDSLCDTEGLVLMLDVGNTYASGDTVSRIDVAAVPFQQAQHWSAQVAWVPKEVSDHAVIILHPQTPDRAGPRPCTPSAMRSLSEAAIADLRLRYAQLALLLRIPGGSAFPSSGLSGTRTLEMR